MKSKGSGQILIENLKLSLVINQIFVNECIIGSPQPQTAETLPNSFYIISLHSCIILLNTSRQRMLLGLRLSNFYNQVRRKEYC